MCYGLVSISFPEVSTIMGSCFAGCSKITNVYLPKLEEINAYAFYICSDITQASFPNLTLICSSAFYGCSKLQSLYLLGSSFVSLQSRTAFYSTPFSRSTYTGTFGSIYVPSSMVASYKTRTN